MAAVRLCPRRRHAERLAGIQTDEVNETSAVRRNVVNVYYKKYSLERARIGRPFGRPKPLDQRAPTEVRTNGRHFIEDIATQRRCAACGLKVREQCKICNVGLHIACFEVVHGMQ